MIEKTVGTALAVWTGLVLMFSMSLATEKLLVDTKALQLPHAYNYYNDFGEGPHHSWLLPHFNWVSPVNYLEGTLYIYYDVIDRPGFTSFTSHHILDETRNSAPCGTDPKSLRVAINGHHHGFSFNVTKIGLNTMSGAFNSMWDVTGLFTPARMSNPPCLRFLLANQAASVNIPFDNPTYYPFTMRAIWVIVAKDDTFSGWDTYLGAQRPIPRPFDSKFSGTYNKEVVVTLKTPSEGAQVRYTTNGTTPTATSPLYDQSFYLSTTTTVKARAFKSGRSSDLTTVRYTISDKSKPVALAALAWEGPTKAKVVFNEPVDETTAETAGNYTLDGGATVSVASLGPDGRTVDLTTSAMTENQGYILSVSGIKDKAPVPNTMTPSQASFTYRSGGNYDDFEGRTRLTWTPRTPSEWTVGQDLRGGCYILGREDYKPEQGRPGEYSLLKDVQVKDFTLDILARTPDDPRDNLAPDFGVIFGFKDYDNFYYLLVSPNPNYCGLYKIAGGTRSSLMRFSSALLPAADYWQYNLVTITAQNNTLTVYLNGQEKGAVTETTAESGQVGVCSYNDQAYFDYFGVAPLNGSPVNNAGDQEMPVKARSVHYTTDQAARKTYISFKLDRPGKVSLTVHSLAGQCLAFPVDGTLNSGRHKAAWDIREVPKGIYVYRIRSGTKYTIGKVTLF